MPVTHPGITQAVGGYAERVKMWGGQKKKLKEYPELWAVLNKWPAPEGLTICSDMDEIANFLRMPCVITGQGGLQIWIHAETDQGTETVNVSDLPERYPVDRNIARMVNMYYPGKGVQRIIVVEKGPKVTLYRNQKRGESLDNVVALTARKVHMGIKLGEVSGDTAFVQLSGNLVWDGDDEDASLPIFQRVFASIVRTKVILDLEDVRRIDSGGLGAIVGVHTSLVKRGGRLVLLHPSARFKEQLETTKLSTIIKTYDSLRAAADSFNIVFE